MQGPEFWLNELGINLDCVVDTDRPAILDDAHRIYINYETYYLSSKDARRTFEGEPWRYTGFVTDPVTQARFQPDAGSPTVRYAGRLFYFSSTDQEKAFNADPAAYATPVVPYSGDM